MLDENYLISCKFVEGPSLVSLDGAVVNYIKTIIDHVLENNLSDVLALQVLDPGKEDQPKKPTAEVEIGRFGTIVLPKSVFNVVEFVPTGWPNTTDLPSDPSGPGPGEHWVKVQTPTKETHRVYVDQMEATEEELIYELVSQEVVIITA